MYFSYGIENGVSDLEFIYVEEVDFIVFCEDLEGNFLEKIPA